MSDRVRLHPNEEGVKPTRRYRSALREEQTRATRRTILAAAHRLFVERGYGGASIEAIAHEAGVAVQTVYGAFGNKRTILARVMAVAIGGDDEAIPLLDRDDPQTVREERDQRRQLRMFSHGIGQILARAGAILSVIRLAADTDPEIARFYQDLQAERLRNLTEVAGWVAQHGPLRNGMSTADAGDIVWTLASAEIHRSLTVDRGWTATRYEEWLGEMLIAALLP